MKNLLNAAILAALCLFVSPACGQELTPKEQAQMEKVWRETPMVEIFGQDEDVTLIAVCRPPFSPKSKALKFVAFVADEFGFADTPKSQSIAENEYRASGKTKWKGKSAVWSLRVRPVFHHEPFTAEPFSVEPPTLDYYLSVTVKKKIVFERGKPDDFERMDGSQMVMIMASPDEIEKAQKRKR